MITVRRSEERGLAEHGWLRSRHTFSFADFHDPRHMGFRALRVINEDQVEPGRGFGRHGHRDMEIISYVLDGALGHEDSLGTGSVIRPGDVQRMSAGTGVLHSEMNASTSEPVHFLQIWILPATQGIAPGYEQRAFSVEERSGALRLVAAPNGEAQAQGAITIHQDARIYAALLGKGQAVSLDLAPRRHAWVQVARGRVTLSGSGEPVALSAGDGAAISDEQRLTLRGEEDAEVLVFDLA